MDLVILWLPPVLLALAVLLPLAWALLRPGRARGRREADVALYRAQLEELDRERDAGRLDEAGHRAARIEVQRRLIAAADQAEPETAARRDRGLVLPLVPLIALSALGLYLLHGSPGMPSAPYTLRAEVQQREDRLLATLRERLAAVDPRSEQARQGWVLLGNAESARGRAAGAIDAWQRAQEVRFEPGLAASIAEAEIGRGAPDAARPWIARGLAEAPGDPRLRFMAGAAEAAAGRPDAARTLWRALLADSPADAPWRPLVERQIANLP